MVFCSTRVDGEVGFGKWHVDPPTQWAHAINLQKLPNTNHCCIDKYILLSFSFEIEFNIYNMNKSTTTKFVRSYTYVYSTSPFSLVCEVTCALAQEFLSCRFNIDKLYIVKSYC